MPHIRLHVDENTGKHNGMATVKYHVAASVELAIQVLDGAIFRDDQDSGVGSSSSTSAHNEPIKVVRATYDDVKDSESVGAGKTKRESDSNDKQEQESKRSRTEGKGKGKGKRNTDPEIMLNKARNQTAKDVINEKLSWDNDDDGDDDDDRSRLPGPQGGYVNVQGY